MLLLRRDDLGDDSCAHGLAAFSEREAQALRHGDIREQLDGHRRVVAGHHHLRRLRQQAGARHVGRAEEKLRPGEYCIIGVL